MPSLFQFSIRGLLYAVTFLAVAIAALLNANGLWQGLAWGAALYALSSAILLTVYRQAEPRAFWLGFAVFGWSYLALFLTAQFPMLTQTWYRSDPLRYEDLFATQAARYTHQNLLPQSRREPHLVVQTPPGNMGGPGMATGGGMPMEPGGGDMAAMMSGMGGGSAAPPGMMGPGMMGGPGPGMMGVAFQATVPNPEYVPLEYFTQIFHALVLLVVAAIGGKTCQLIFRTRPRTEQ